MNYCSLTKIYDCVSIASSTCNGKVNLPCLMFPFLRYYRFLFVFLTLKHQWIGKNPRIMKKGNYETSVFNLKYFPKKSISQSFTQKIVVKSKKRLRRAIFQKDFAWDATKILLKIMFCLFLPWLQNDLFIAKI